MPSPFSEVWNRRVAIINVDRVTVGFLLRMAKRKKKKERDKKERVFHFQAFFCYYIIVLLHSTAFAQVVLCEASSLRISILSPLAMIKLRNQF